MNNFMPHSLRTVASAALAAFLSFAAPLRAQSASTDSPATPAFREVMDEVGRTVHVPQPVRRIVSLAPSMTETIYALGLQDRLVGDTDYCDYPPDAQTKPKVGGGINPSLEKIVSLHPDLVLVTKAFNRRETADALDGLGISYYATDPHTVDDIIASAKKLSEVLGAPDAGVAVAGEMQRRLDELRRRLAAAPPKSVLFVVWTKPLISIGRGTFIADALRRAGAVSIVDSSQDWPQVNLEEIVRLQPDYLVFADSHSETVSREVDTLATLPAWRILNAIANRRFAVISDAVNRPAPRIVSAIEELARQLHPEAFVEKPPDARERIEKLNPPASEKPSPNLAFVMQRQLLEHRITAGGCACAL